MIGSIEALDVPLLMRCVLFCRFPFVLVADFFRLPSPNMVVDCKKKNFVYILLSVSRAE